MNSSVNKLIGIIGAPNDDEVIRYVSSIFFYETLNLEDLDIQEIVHDLSIAFTFEDPFKTGAVANIIGGLIESGKNLDLSNIPIMQWADRIISNADLLYFRICEQLPKFELSTIDEFESKRIELKRYFPIENRSWETLERYYTSITTIMANYPNFRKHNTSLFDKSKRISKFLPVVKYIYELSLIDYDTLYYIIQPNKKRGIIANVSNIETNFQLFVLISNVLHNTFNEDEYKVPSTILDFYTLPQNQEDYFKSSSEIGLFNTHMRFYNWQAIQDDLQMPNETDYTTYMDYPIYSEWKPDDIPMFANAKVILILDTNTLFHLGNFKRNFPFLNPNIKLEKVLSNSEINSILSDFRTIKLINSLKTDTAYTSKKNQIIILQKEIYHYPEKHLSFLYCRLTRRLIPVVKLYWGKIPHSDLFTIINILTIVESNMINNNEIDIKNIFDVLSQVQSRINRAEQVGYSNKIPVLFASTLEIILRLLHDGRLTSYLEHFLYSIFTIYEESEKYASIAGFDINNNGFYDMIREDIDTIKNRHKEQIWSYEKFGPFWNENLLPSWWPLTSEFSTDRDFEVAISFAGEDREIARAITAGLITKGSRVFYDEREQDKIWGNDLNDYLFDIFKNRSEFCIILISSYYIQKQWTLLELNAAISRQMNEKYEYILPIRLDDSTVDAISSSISILDIRKVGLNDIISLITGKIRNQFLNSSKLNHKQ